MANTYTSIYIHLIFAVKNREAMLLATFRERLFQYMLKVVSAEGHTPVAIGGTASHIHLLIKYNINKPLPDLVRVLKASSSKFINENHFINFRFEWQRGYGAFSHSDKDLTAVAEYIRHQPEHHSRVTMNQELRILLERHGVDYDERYILYEVKD